MPDQNNNPVANTFNNTFMPMLRAIGGNDQSSVGNLFRKLLSLSKNNDKDAAINAIQAFFKKCQSDDEHDAIFAQMKEKLNELNYIEELNIEDDINNKKLAEGLYNYLTIPQNQAFLQEIANGMDSFNPVDLNDFMQNHFTGLSNQFNQHLDAIANNNLYRDPYTRAGFMLGTYFFGAMFEFMQYSMDPENYIAPNRDRNNQLNNQPPVMVVK